MARSHGSIGSIWLFLQPHRIHSNKNLPMHVCVEVQVGLTGGVDGEGIGAYPAAKEGVEKSSAEVDGPNLNIIFLAGDSVVRGGILRVRQESPTRDGLFD